MSEFNSGIGGSELPMHRIFLAVSLGKPRLYLTGHLFNGRYPSLQALSAHGAYFPFRHSKP